ncbi:MAG TPA: DUF4150 domain-containing protein [Polyangium sp.]|nr:DUF4150 domain-containing protein [Polyangium sp.]
MADVFANFRSILHKGDGLQHVAAPPDVCKTPSPAGPVPIPYPNMAMSSALADGTKKVKINGQPVATEASNLSTSVGDEPGTAGGIISNKFKGKLTWGSSSTDVKFEGKGVTRFLDVTQHNNNSFNTAFIALGEGRTAVAYGDDFDHLCKICNKGPKEHRIHETENSLKKCKQIVDGLLNEYRRLVDRRMKLVKDLEEGLALLDEARGGYDQLLELRWTRLSDAARAGFKTRERYVKNQSFEKEWSKELEQINNYKKDIIKINEDINKITRNGNGYMVGVMICRCGKAFAAMSGSYLKGLNDFAVNAGCKPIEFTEGNAVKAQDLINSNQSNADDRHIRRAIERAWAGTLRAQTTKKGYNEPGTCAAMKLLTRADCHAPAEMTEMFFDPHVGNADAWKGTYNWLVTEASHNASWKDKALQNRLSTRTPREFKAGQSVASCHTCQALLYMTNCPVRKCPK